MLRLDLTLPTPAENLALDEALLDQAEHENSAAEFIRLWESPQPIVVLGRSSRWEHEVDESACSARQIPILRRSSGGAAIVAGPGCLMYAVVLSYKLRPELRDIRRAHAFALDRSAASLCGLGFPVARAGTSDLIMGNPLTDFSSLRTPYSGLKKFSGNSLRAKRTHLLYHGTLLYSFDLALIEMCLRTPPRQPEYRGARSHADFVTNLPIGRGDLLRAVDAAWPASGQLHDWPAAQVAKLVAERFSHESWNRNGAVERVRL
jgi:lipoate-protein ligase A